MSGAEHRVGAVIPTLAGGERLLRTVTALARELGEAGELVVVADGARVPGLDDLPDHVRTVQLAERRGFAAVVNAGVKALAEEPEWVAVVNDDLEVAPGFLAAMRLADAADETGGLACEIRFDPPREIVNSRGIGMTPAGWVIEIDSGRPAELPRTAAPLLGPAGALGFYRWSVWRDLGGFDERFWAYGEDADLAWRMACRGWQTELRPDAVAFHAHGATTGQRSELKAYLSSRNRTLFRAKRFGTAERLRHLPGEVAREALWMTRDLRHGSFRAWARGKRDGLRGSAAAAEAGRPFREPAGPLPVLPSESLVRAVRRKRRVDALASGR